MRQLVGLVAAFLLVCLLASGQYDQRYRERLLEQWYGELNAQYFNGQLPSGVIVVYESGMLARGHAAESNLVAGTSFIHLDDHMIPFQSVSMMLVAHEACHIALWNVPQPQGTHAREFQTCMKSLARAGAFEGIW